MKAGRHGRPAQPDDVGGKRDLENHEPNQRGGRRHKARFLAGVTEHDREQPEDGQRDYDGSDAMRVVDGDSEIVEGREQFPKRERESGNRHPGLIMAHDGPGDELAENQRHQSDGGGASRAEAVGARRPHGGAPARRENDREDDEEAKYGLGEATVNDSQDRGPLGDACAADHALNHNGEKDRDGQPPHPAARLGFPCPHHQNGDEDSDKRAEQPMTMLQRDIPLAPPAIGIEAAEAERPVRNGKPRAIRGHEAAPKYQRNHRDRAELREAAEPKI